MRSTKKDIVLTLLCITVLAGPLIASSLDKYNKSLPPQWTKTMFDRSAPDVYSGDDLKYIGMPVGGICTGTLYLAGDGTLWNWDIFNIKTMNPGGGGDKFYLKPMLPEKIFDHGFTIQTMVDGKTAIRPLDKTGFKNISFQGQYPVGTVNYSDPDCPVDITLKAFSPFIPTDADDSGLPATVMQYTLTNPTDKTVTVAITGHLQNPVCIHSAQKAKGKLVNRAVATDNITQLVCSAESFKTGKTSYRPDITIDDFETGNFDKWTVQGTAFGTKPVNKSNLPQRQPLKNTQGKHLVNSHNFRSGESSPQSDAHTGKLTSKLFSIQRDYITFMISGGSHKNKTEIRLLIDGKIIAAAQGDNSNNMKPKSFDVRLFYGKKAILEIVDNETGPWGHICLDNILLSDHLTETVKLDHLPDYGTMALSLLNRQKGDLITTHANAPSGAALVDGELAPQTSAPLGDNLTGAISRKLTLKPNQTQTVTFVISWFFPNLHTGHNGLSGLRNMENLRAYYSKRFNSADQVARYINDNSEKLIDSTLLWNKTWYDSTLPYWFLDRIFIPADSLATTVFQRFHDLTGDPINDGRIYAWEGVYLGNGTCTHVLHYEQAMGRLFPNMTRQLREQIDYGLSFRDDGVIKYRAEFSHQGHHYGTQHAVDGHCGTILRTYREHTMSPDNTFLQRLYPKIKKSVQVLIDQDKAKTGKPDGILEGPQYNTLDRTWYGKIPWTSTMYCAALRAGAEMAQDMNDPEFAKLCTNIANMGYKNIPAELFNGQYFIQKLDEEKLYAPNVNKGCHIDQMLGQSWAHQTALDRILPEGKSKTALASIFKYNFQSDVGPYLDKSIIKPLRFYATPGEAGTVICSFPKGGADKAPGQVRNDWEKLVIGYFSECMTGFEYQAASHMIAQGLTDEGFAIVRAINDRYHPSKRNPYNEVEYGNHYSRAMSSYGCLIAASGFQYIGPEAFIAFEPTVTPENFKAPFTSANGWGTFSQQRIRVHITQRIITQKNIIELKYGTLRLKTVQIGVNINADTMRENYKKALKKMPGMMPGMIHETMHETMPGTISDDVLDMAPWISYLKVKLNGHPLKYDLVHKDNYLTITFDEQIIKAGQTFLIQFEY